MLLGCHQAGGFVVNDLSVRFHTLIALLKKIHIRLAGRHSPQTTPLDARQIV